MNNLSTQQLILGNGLVTATGNILYINGLPFATAANLQLTGQVLYNDLVGLSGQFNTNFATVTNLASTGQQAWNSANNNGINLSGNLTQTGLSLLTINNNISGVIDGRLFNTGSILYNDIISLSGLIGSASTPNAVFTTGIQNINGYKTFNSGFSLMQSGVTGLIFNPTNNIFATYIDTLGTTGVDFNLGKLYVISDSRITAGSLSIDFSNRTLNRKPGPGGSPDLPVVDWYSGMLSTYNVSTVTPSVDWQHRVLINSSNIDTVDYQDSWLLDNNSGTAIDWNNYILSGNWNIQSGIFNETLKLKHSITGSNFVLGNRPFYINTGLSPATWTLPTISSSIDTVYQIKNCGNSLLLTGFLSSDRIFAQYSVLTFTINSGESYQLANNGQFWCIM